MNEALEITTLVNLAEALEVNTHATCKVSLISIDIYRWSSDIWILSDTSDGWTEAHITPTDLQNLKDGIRTLDSLEWD